jgi:tungstate transport system substrate-binding protein
MHPGLKKVSKIAGILLIAVLLVGLVPVIAGCTEEEPAPAPAPAPAPSPAPAPAPAPERETKYALHDPLTRFKIATTTSLYDTGLWYYLEPIFEKKEGVEMDIIYAGTGIALEYGRRGDVDAVIVHDKAAEDKFIGEGYGINRRNFGYNFFLIAGPPDDPAGIKGSTAADSFKKIHDAGMANPDAVKFISRGDNSGTHSKEKLIWKAAGFEYEDIQNSGKWYVEAGKGMGPTLLMANEMQAYVLADISTFLAYNKKNPLAIESLVEQDAIFLNVYAAMAINPEKYASTKIDIANDFINWLIGPEVQEIMGTYGKSEYGRSLFNPIGRGVEDGSANLPGFPPPEAYTTPVPKYSK